MPREKVLPTAQSMIAIQATMIAVAARIVGLPALSQKAITLRRPYLIDRLAWTIAAAQVFSLLSIFRFIPNYLSIYSARLSTAYTNLLVPRLKRLIGLFFNLAG